MKKKQKNTEKPKFLDRFANFVVEYKYIVLSIFITLTILCGAGFFFVRVNSDITSYLPADSQTAVGQDFLRENFDMDGDFLVVVKNPASDMDAGKKSLKEKVDKITRIKHVTQVLWIGSSAFSSIKWALGDEVFQQIADILYRDDCFVMIGTLDISSSSDAAFKVLDQCAVVLDGESYTFGGSVASSMQIFDETLNSMPIFLAIAVAVVFIILLLTTKSWLEPFILLASIGVAIVINMGSNIIFTDVSVITQACSAVLQIGLTMDFAIFLMHAYHNAMDRTHNPYEAMKIAIPKTLTTISASALTTVGGFVAMCFMRMTFGMDLAKVLIKGIIISLATIIMLQPVLMLIFKTPLEKGKHKYINYSFKTPVRATVKLRYVVGVLCLGVIGVCCWAQTNLQYSYMKLQVKNEEPTVTEQIAESMGNQIIIAVPSNDVDAQYPFIEDLKNVHNVNSVMGLYAFVPEENKNILDLIPADMMASFNKNGFTMYTIEMGVENETLLGELLLQNITGVVEKHFGKNYYISGTAQAIADLKAITPDDLALVSLISAAIIAVIILITLKSFKKTLAVLLLIMGGIWINLTLFMLMKGEVNFITVIAINAIQLGATVDYAILMSSTYKDFRKRGFKPVDAANAAARQSAMSIVTSASILVGACMSVFLVSKNVIVSEITSMIAVGAALSALLVIFVLPGMLSVCDINFIFRRNAAEETAGVADTSELDAAEKIGEAAQLANLEQLIPTVPKNKKYRKMLIIPPEEERKVIKKERKAVKKADKRAEKAAEKEIEASLEKLNEDENR